MFQITPGPGNTFRRIFEVLFRKGHIATYDLMDLDVYLAKRMLPKFEAYRHNYIHRKGAIEIPGQFASIPLNKDETYLIEGETFNNQSKAWIGIMDEIIFALKWVCFVHHTFPGNNKLIDFYTEYFGSYISREENAEKNRELENRAEKRAKEGLILMGKHFVNFWY